MEPLSGVARRARVGGGVRSLKSDDSEEDVSDEEDASDRRTCRDGGFLGFCLTLSEPSLSLSTRARKCTLFTFDFLSLVGPWMY